MLAIGLSFFVVKYVKHIYFKNEIIYIYNNLGKVWYRHSGTLTINYRRNHCFPYSVEIDDTYVIFHPEESVLSQ